MHTRRAILVVDLAFGDCGKGSVVDFLARRHPGAVVVRFNGGPQAGHNVVTPDGRHHTFSQFGSGTFVHGLTTLLSRFMLIEPYALLNEARHLDEVGVPDALGRLTIDARCPVITPAHQAANRLREIARGDAAHGTCGIGVGEAVRFAGEFPELVIRAGDLHDRAVVRSKLRATCEAVGSALRTEGVWINQTSVIPNAPTVRNADPTAHAAATLLDTSWIDAAADNYAEVAANVRIVDALAAGRLIREASTLLFEGAQGVLLDEDFGFHPHTTWSRTTFANAETVLDEARSDADRFRLGVLRSYYTRHGAGPLVTEDAALSAALPEPHNTAAGWQGRFRVGRFDAVAAKYALDLVGRVDALAVTHLDRLPAVGGEICVAYRGPPEVRDLQVRRPADLVWQERLTQLLRTAEPIYERWPTEPAEFCDRLSAELKAPIAIRSSGRTAGNKRLSPSGARLVPSSGTPGEG